MLKGWRQRIALTDIVVWAMGAAIGLAVIYGTTVTWRTAQLTPEQWIYLTIDGLKLGGIYSLIALGYTLVYGILRMINVAQSEVFMSGPFTAVFLAKYLNSIGFFNKYPVLSLLLVTLLSAAVSAIIAILLERIAYRPLRFAPRLVPLISAIGASFFLQYTFRGMYGKDPEIYPTLDILKGVIFIGPIPVPKIDVLVILSSMGLMLIFFCIVQYTKMGKAMRSVSEDKRTAALMGINVDRVIVFTFTLGGISAGIAGVLYALIFGQVHFYMGFIPGFKAFTSAVLGGIGNVPGAWLGGTLLGLIESLGPNLFLSGFGIPAVSQLKDGIAFAVLVFILVFRPQGLLGEQVGKSKM